MNPLNSESNADNNENGDEGVSNDRRAALTKLAYGSPAIAALLFSRSAAAQGSICTRPRGPLDPPRPPQC